LYITLLYVYEAGNRSRIFNSLFTPHKIVYSDHATQNQDNM